MARGVGTKRKIASTGEGELRQKGRPRRQAGASPDGNSRDRLLSAAIELFATYGYEPVSTGQVAAAAGLTQSMVHYHFQSKSKLWKAAIEKMMRERGAMFPVLRMDLRDLDALSRLKVLIRRFILTSAAHPELARIALHEGMARTPRLRWLVQKYIGVAHKIFDQTVEEAIALGLLRDLPVHQITTIILTTCSLPFTIAAWTKEIYHIESNDPAQVDAFSNSVMETLFFGLQSEKPRQQS